MIPAQKKRCRKVAEKLKFNFVFSFQLQPQFSNRTSSKSLYMTNSFVLGALETMVVHSIMYLKNYDSFNSLYRMIVPTFIRIMLPTLVLTTKDWTIQTRKTITRATNQCCQCRNKSIIPLLPRNFLDFENRIIKNVLNIYNPEFIFMVMSFRQFLTFFIIRKVSWFRNIGKYESMIYLWENHVL